MPNVVTIDVQTINGYGFFPFYNDISGANIIADRTAAGFTATNPSATNFPAGLSFAFHSSTNDFTYDASGHPTGGTINSITITDTSGVPLVTETGYSIPIVTMLDAIAAFNASSHTDAGALNAIFNQFSYNMDGNFGPDDFVSAANADTFNGEGNFGGNNWVSYQNAAAGVTADIADDTRNTGEAAGDTYTNIQNLRGSIFNDTLIGDNGNNFLRGGGGADWLQGGGGIDTADYKGAPVGVIADLGNSANNTGVAAGDTYSSIENLRGSDFDDALRGDGGNNALTGGLGADRFIVSPGNDTVRDFDQGSGVFDHTEGDRIDLGNSQIYNFAELQSHLSQPGFNTVIDLGSGNSITLNNVDIDSLTASDFVFTQPPKLLVSIGGGTIASGGHALHGGTFSNFFGFGDSTIDSGWFRNTPISNDPHLQADYDAAKAAGGGIPTTLGGQMASTLLAQDYGLSADPANAPGGGTNYAASSATVTGSRTNSLAPSMVDQVNSYLASTGNHADPNAIYLISGGGNSAGIAATLDPVSAIDHMISEADALAASIEQLHDAGAQYFVLNFFAGAKSLNIPFANELITDLSNAGISFIVGDELSLINNIDANPAAYGITNTVRPPAGPFSPGNPYDPNEGGATINPDPQAVVNGWARFATTNAAPDANTAWLWADDQHFAGAGQQAEADYLHSLIQNAIPVVGETLTATPTLVNGTGPVTCQWQRFDSGHWSDITGATGASYTVQFGDIGDELRVEAFNSFDNGNSTVSSSSAPTFAVQNTQPTVVVDVLTPDGVSLGGLYQDIAHASAVAPGATHNATHYDAIDVGTGHTFRLIGTGFIYDAQGNVTGGTVTEVDLLRTSDNTTLLTEKGFSIDVATLNSALNALQGHGHDSSQLTAILDQYMNVVKGGAGNDVFQGFAQHDVFEGGGGINLVDYSSATSGIIVDLADPRQNTGIAAGDSYHNIQGIIGTAFNDTLIGDSGDNILRGGGGVDTMSGGAGDDKYFVDNSNDVVDEAVGSGSDTVITTTNYTLAAGSEIERLFGHSDTGLILTGNGFDQTIKGGAGNDTIDGGGGSDKLFGGDGADSFVLHPADFATILDYQQGTDTLEIMAAEFGHGLVAGQSATVVDAASISRANHAGTNGYFIFDTTGGGAHTLYWDATGGSGSDAVAIAKIDGASSLTAADFHIV